MNSRRTRRDREIGVGFGMGWRTVVLLALGIGVTVPVLHATTEPVGLERYEYRRVVFGVEARVVMYCTDVKTATTAAEGAWRRFDELDAIFSDWRVDSELSLLRESPVGTGIPVSEELFAMLSSAGRLHAATGGAFDATVGPFVDLWREARSLNRIPGDRALAAAATRVGWDKLKLLPGAGGNKRAGRVLFTVPGMSLDLGGIAKGYGAQEALRIMNLLGVNRALVEVGGDLAAGDPPPDRDGWETLAGCGPGRAVRVTLVNESLAVSGDTEQYLDVDGTRFSHVVDPRTGQAVTQRTCATIVAKDGATADALASAMQVLGPREGRRIVRQVVGARVVHAERLDLPIARQFRDPLRVAPRLDADLGGLGSWSEEGGVLVGRLFQPSSPSVTFSAGANWSLEMDAWGDQGADLIVHPDAAKPGQDVVRLTIESGAGNHWEVRCAGFDRRIAVWRDGELVRDVHLPSSHGELDDERELAISMVVNAVEGGAGGQTVANNGRVASAATRSGPLGVVRVRGLRLRRLDSVDEDGLSAQGGGKLVLTADAKAKGWRPLIDLGLGQWEEHKGDYIQGPFEYIVTDGVLHIPSHGGGQLRTKRDYKDFRLRLEFKLAPGANSGLFLRGDRAGGDPAYSGCEVQIIDDHGWEELAGFALQPRQQCGSLYAAVPADEPGALRPTGEWNTYEVLYLGSRLAVALNGHVLYDVDTLSLDCQPPFAERAGTGFIGLQRYGAPHVKDDTALWVRNMFVRELTARPEEDDGEDAEPGMGVEPTTESAPESGRDESAPPEDQSDDPSDDESEPR